MAGKKRTADDRDVPVSLRRRATEPTKLVQFRIPLSWWEELSGLGREFDQGVSTFLREATEDWLRRARKVNRRDIDVPIGRSPLGE